MWWDRDIDSGQSFHKVIQQALTAAPAVIVVWTNESVQSEWVLNEASDARTRDRLVPVLLDPVTPPLEFRHLQAADLSGWKGDSADPQFIGLHKGVSAILRQSYGPPPPRSVLGPHGSGGRRGRGRRSVPADSCLASPCCCLHSSRWASSALSPRTAPSQGIPIVVSPGPDRKTRGEVRRLETDACAPGARRVRG